MFKFKNLKFYGESFERIMKFCTIYFLVDHFGSALLCCQKTPCYCQNIDIFAKCSQHVNGNNVLWMKVVLVN